MPTMQLCNEIDERYEHRRTMTHLYVVFNEGRWQEVGEAFLYKVLEDYLSIFSPPWDQAAISLIDESRRRLRSS